MNVVRAAVVGDVETVKQWLSALQHRRTGHARQVLHRAAQHGHDSICQLVLNSGDVSDDNIAPISINSMSVQSVVNSSVACKTWSHQHKTFDSSFIKRL